jgi:uncharacterized membrane protein
MRLDLSFLGWIHSLSCIAALALGGVNLARPKGTKVHRRVGQAYLLAILVVGITSLGIYSQNRFFFPHWLAVITIVLAVFSYLFAHFCWPAQVGLRGHFTCTVLTYYLLVGGGVNEAFLRINALRQLSGGFPSPLIGITHLLLLTLTALAVAWLNISYNQRRLPMETSEPQSS